MTVMALSHFLNHCVDGDLISIVDDFDVKQAVCLGQVLRIKVYGTTKHATHYTYLDKERVVEGKKKLDISAKDQLLELKARIDLLLNSLESVVNVKEEAAPKEDAIALALSATHSTGKKTLTTTKSALNASDMAELLGVASLDHARETKKEQQEVKVKSEETKKLPQTPQSPTPAAPSQTASSSQPQPSQQPVLSPAPQASSMASLTSPQIASQSSQSTPPQMQYISPAQQQQMMQHMYGSQASEYNHVAAAYAAYYNNYQQQQQSPYYQQPPQ